jgi:hypothetical protein
MKPGSRQSFHLFVFYGINQPRAASQKLQDLYTEGLFDKRSIFNFSVPKPVLLTHRLFKNKKLLLIIAA